MTGQDRTEWVLYNNKSSKKLGTIFFELVF